MIYNITCKNLIETYKKAEEFRIQISEEYFDYDSKLKKYLNKVLRIIDKGDYKNQFDNLENEIRKALKELTYE